MSQVAPIRTSMWRAGSVMLALGLIACLVGLSADRLTSPGIELAPPSNGRSWVALAFIVAAMLVCGCLYASEKWSKWRDGELTQSVTVTQTPVTHVLWTWTRVQVVVAVLFVVAGIGLALLVARTGTEEFGLVTTIALVPGSFGMSYLMLARRVRKLEQERSVVYFWQRRPGVDDFVHVGVYMLPVYDAVW